MAALVDGLARIVRGDSLEANTPDAIWMRRAGKALHDAGGAGIVTVGAWQPPAVQSAVHRLNDMLGHTGRTVFYTQPALAQTAGIGPLLADMQAGRVQTLVMLDTNPAYTVPGFAEALTRVPLKVHAGLHGDETALRSDWHLPLLHPLESWGDPRALDGTVTLMQPTIMPLYDGRSVAEISRC